MEEDLGCTFFNFIDFVVAVQVNFGKKLSFICHLVKIFEMKFYVKILLCKIFCQFYAVKLNKVDFLKIINL